MDGCTAFVPLSDGVLSTELSIGMLLQV